MPCYNKDRRLGDYGVPVDEMRNALQSQSFRLYAIRFAGGRKYRSGHQEFVPISSIDRTVVVFHSHGTQVSLDATGIKGTHIGNGRTCSRRTP